MAVAFLICFLPTSFKLFFAIALEPCKAAVVKPCLAANDVPPVIGVVTAANIAVGSVTISIPASLISSTYCLKLPMSALSNLERK